MSDIEIAEITKKMKKSMEKRLDNQEAFNKVNVYSDSSTQV